jgi:inner membrane protein
MENQEQQPQFRYPAPERHSIWQSTTARVIMVSLLTLVLLLPLQYVKSLIWERQELQKNVTNELAEQWGGDVYFYGPILKVPYKVITETEITDRATKQVTVRRTAETDYAYFFPDELKAKANVTTDKKNRGNYESTVFSSTMNFNGYYPTPSFNGRNIAPENIMWDKATVLIRTGGLKSIKGAVAIKLNGIAHAFEPVAKEDGNNAFSSSSLETLPINLTDTVGKRIAFNLDINYDGTQQISIVPIGKLTEASMASNWPHPDFNGGFLPYTKDIKEDGSGFTASWKVSHLNRAFSQQYFTSLPDLAHYAFSTNFIIPNDQYQQNERAAKYGFLVIGLTFVIFFLIQTISKISIHLFQYGMIGVALIMFYTLLISITEHSSFAFAYLISGVAVVVMISLYSISILKNIKFPAFIAASLTALYTFIYVIIQLENYALLAGSIGLFFILGAVMYASRKIDWGNTGATANN